MLRDSLDLGNANSPTPAPLKTLLQGIVGIVIMFTAAMSFLIAAVAFAARLIILIILLAFSPVWFAAMIFPILDSKKKQYTDMLKGQLIFMPIYLLLLYAAMTIITKSTIFNDTATSSLNGTVAAGAWIPKDLIVLAINDFFIIFLLNLPLVTAFSMAGSSVKWLEGATKRFNTENVWQRVGQFAGRNTIGRGANFVRDSRPMKALYNVPGVGVLAHQTLSKGASLGFGDKKASFDAVRKSKVEARAKMAESAKLNEFQTNRRLNANGGRLILEDKGYIDLQNKSMQIASDATAQKSKVATIEAEKASLISIWGPSSIPVKNKQAELDKEQKMLTDLENNLKENMKQGENLVKAIKERVQNEPKENIRESYESKSSGRFGSFNKAVADKIKKGKDPYSDIMDKIAGMEDKIK